MEERLARKIMSRYFKTKGVKAHAQRGAGPDFLEAGKAIEIKGSGANFNKAISQYIRYIFRYSDLAVAMPIDLLKAENLFKFDLLCRIVYQQMTKYVKAYLISKGRDGKEYFVKEFYDGRDVLHDVQNYLANWGYFSSGIEQDAIDQIDANLTLVNIAIQEALEHTVSSKYDMILYATEL